jgi:hypothetical protein
MRTVPHGRAAGPGAPCKPGEGQRAEGGGRYLTRRARILAVDSNTDFENKPSR